MHCRACDCLMTDNETNRKSTVTSEYLDMCNACLRSIIEDIPESVDIEDEVWDEVLEEDLESD